MSDANTAVKTPVADLKHRAGEFLIEHAYHEQFTFDDPQGMRGVFATCMTCHASIHFPFEVEVTNG